MADLDPKRKLVLPEPLLGLTGSCCTICLPECCGVDAYEVSADHMVRWIVEHGLLDANKALSQLDELTAWASAQTEQLWSDGPEFNAIWYRLACVGYLQLWRSELVRALSLVPREVESKPGATAAEH